MTINNHGDLILYPVKKLKPPKDAIKNKLHVLQDSGATGNRHEVVSGIKPIFRWTKNDKEFIHCEVDYSIRHVGGDGEHGTQKVEAGTHEVMHEMEHDPWKNELKRVID